MQKTLPGSGARRKSSRDTEASVEVLPAFWRQLLRNGGASVAGDAGPVVVARDEGRLGLLLDLRDRPGPLARLQVAPVLLDAGGGRSQPIDLADVPGSGLLEAERALLGRLAAFPRSARKGRSYVELTGEGADDLLACLLARAHCFLGGIAGFCLRPGAPLQPQWAWQLAEDGSQHLLPTLENDRHVLQVGEAWYVDAGSEQMGRLLDPLLSAGLLDAPPLEPKQAAELARELPDSALAGRVPQPTVYAEPEALDCRPESSLVLHALTRHARLAAGMPPMAWASLVFDYGGVRLSGYGNESPLRRVQHHRLVEVHRHRAEELEVLERLEALGLVPAVDCEGLPWEMTELLPEDAWLFPGAGASGALEVNTPSRWMAMRARIADEGLELEYDRSFPFEVVDADLQWFVQAVAGRKRRNFRLKIGVQVDGKRIDLLPAAAVALAEGQWDLTPDEAEVGEAVWHAPLDDRRRLPVPLQPLRALLLPVAEYLEHPGKKVVLPWGQAGRLEELAAALPEDGVLDTPDPLQGLAGRLRDAAGRADAREPKDFVGTLRPYQREGLRWLNALAEAGLGGVLADDMGLGKTVQLLAHVLSLKEAGALDRPVLVVVPTSLLPNWQAEMERYAPGLSCLVVHGPGREAELSQLAGQDLILTTYALLPRDLKVYRQQSYALLVLDEAQQVKNPRTQARRAASILDAERRICLTGTPMENHLGELWSQLDLAVPGLLGSERSFHGQYRVPIEKHGDAACQARLNQRIAPFILRRSKAEVARELPPKTRITRRVVFEGAQRRLYDGLEEDLYQRLRETIASQGVERSGMVVLDALLKLRQVCCDPRLLKGEQAPARVDSAKFEALMEMLPELIAEGRHILLFSQFTEMLGLIAEALDACGIEYVQLTGQTRDRAEPVARFQDGRVRLFLLSLKAGGVGLNLTAADTVIHYDPWWNPAAEAQASDRAHRIGQDKPVFVYRLICADTVEERIEALKARKAELADAILAGGGSSKRLQFTEDDVDALFGGN